MSDPAPPCDEAERLRALDRYAVLDTPREAEFDDIAELAATICDAPIAVVNLIGDGRQFFKAEVGLGVRETPLDTSFCRQAILQTDFLYVPDATRDARFSGNPLVTGAPGLRFYAGALLKTPDGYPIGTVCVLDTAPRTMSERQIAALRRLARQAMGQLELRRLGRELREQQRLQAQILDSATDYAIVATDPAGRVTRWTEGARRILGWREEEVLGRPIETILNPEDGTAAMRCALARQGSAPREAWHRRRNGDRFWASAEAMPLRTEGGEAAGFLTILRDRTAQRRAAEALSASERRFRSLVEVSPQIVWFAGADGAITDFNPYWYDYTGASPDAACTETWLAAIHPEHRARVLGARREAVRAAEPYELEIPFRRGADGAHRWFLARGKPLRGEGGEVEGWIGIAVDIDERRQAEAALQEARDQLRLAVEATDIGIFDYDLRTGMLVWDDRVRALFGLSAGKPVSYDVFLSGLHAGDRNWVDAAVRTALDPAGSGQFAVSYRTVGLEDGIERWVAAHGRAIREGGRTVRFVGTVLDVTAQRRAEQDLRATEERYRLAARATNDAIWDWNLATDHILWNEAVQTLFGYAPESVGPSGAWWKSRIHPDDRARVSRDIDAVIAGGGEHWSDEYRFLRADGSYADILDRGYVIRDPQGRAVRMIGAMLDITARKRAEEHRKLLTEELQHRVKNSLALVQAIASQTFRNATDLEAAREAFAARLISLGRAHDILTQTSWTAAPIAEVVAGALSVHRHAGTPRIRAAGPTMLLGAKAALSLALALHELATNAAKYGALSNETGFVDLRWHMVHRAGEPWFSLTWTEQGGPPVLAPPTRKGFGSRLIERSFSAESGGAVRLTYAPAGLVCCLEAPLAAMQEGREGGPD